ncbi:hypothetical protein K4L06_17765 [Lysobacter sp. BMK333-48F3]|uniref:hypothetical protein n=1 Tax=Lysobacter sp. BMK333-48F3 TaxID=2867962 RepID=UPI001C8C05AA|nr:hypothetical protein [Lysobacter sp. BMK333-48F3]MBX9403160.1 hypothetical protein [Lysobacter sp. BMK333-48F3]
MKELLQPGACVATAAPHARRSEFEHVFSGDSFIDRRQAQSVSSMRAAAAASLAACARIGPF